MAKNTEEKIEFPFVTKNFTVVNHTSDTIRVHFNSIAAGVGHVLDGFHFVELDSDEDSYTFDVKCREVYISAPNDGSAREFRVIASLTQIPADAMFAITGSGLTDIGALEVR
jgi:hypothetical protein